MVRSLLRRYCAQVIRCIQISMLLALTPIGFLRLNPIDLNQRKLLCELTQNGTFCVNLFYNFPTSLTLISYQKFYNPNMHKSSSVVTTLVFPVVRTVVKRSKKGFWQSSQNRTISRNPLISSLFPSLYLCSRDINTTHSICEASTACITSAI